MDSRRWWQPTCYTLACLLLIPTACRTRGARTVRIDSDGPGGRCQWEHVSTAPRTFWELQFLNSQQGFGLADDCLWRTDDQARQWEKVYCGEKGESSKPLPSGMQFLSATDGWMWDDKNLLHTADGGRTWAGRQFEEAIIRDVHFLDADHGWWTGQVYLQQQAAFDAVVYQTSDGGRTWRKLPAPEGGLGETLMSVWPRTEGDLWVAGDRVFHRELEAAQWHEAVPTQVAVDLGNVNIRFHGPRVGWIRRIPARNFLWSGDGGHSWEVREFPPELPGQDEILFVSEQEGWMTAGYLYHTLDAGRTWTRPLGLGPAALDGVMSDVFFSELEYLPEEQMLFVGGTNRISICRP